MGGRWLYYTCIVALCIGCTIGRREKMLLWIAWLNELYKE